jgi:TatD DNase family protein
VRLYDTHCHLHDKEAFPDPEAALDRARAAGVSRFNVVGVNPADWDAALSFADRFDDVFALLGWHPNYTADYNSASLSTLRPLLNHPKVVGLGEIGLDRHWTYAPFDQQLVALEDQLALASEFSLPIIFHVREAFADFIPVLQRRGPDRYVIHCFSGTTTEILPLAELGCWFGADGPVTYRKNEELREAFAAVPVETWLLETDSPYMAPVPHRGKPNEPAYLREILGTMADVANLPPEALAETLWENSVIAFSRMPKAPT